MGKPEVRNDMGAVEQTLLLPLWARAVETQKTERLIRDPAAVEIMAKMDTALPSINRSSLLAETKQIQLALRAYHFDRCIRAFLEKHEAATVINLGTGLDTTFQRVDDGNVRWFNIELPAVAGLRQQFIPDSERETTIARSVLDFSWMEEFSVQTEDRTVLVVAAGILYYFSEAQVKGLVRRLAEDYPQAEMLFDVLSSWLWNAVTNWGVIRQNGFDPSVRLRWYMPRASQLTGWVQTLRVLDDFSMSERVGRFDSWGWRTRWEMQFANLFKAYKMVHVRF